VQAIAIWSEHPESRFLAAKARFAQGKLDLGVADLTEAIRLDAGYAVKAATEPDLLAHEGVLIKLLKELRRQRRAEAEPVLDRARAAVMELELSEGGGFTSAAAAEA